MSCKDYYSETMSRYALLDGRQERELIASLRDDEPKLREMLVLHNMRAAVAIGRRYSARIEATDENIQKAVLGLVKAAESFRPESGVRFLSYAAFKMVREVTYGYMVNDGKMDMMCISLQQVARSANGEGRDAANAADALMRNSALEGTQAMNDRAVSEAFGYEEVRSLIADKVADTCCLTEKEKCLVMDCIDLASDTDHKGFGVVATAAKHGVKRQRVQQVLKKALPVLRAKLTPEFDWWLEERGMSGRLKEHEQRVEARWRNGSAQLRALSGDNERLAAERERLAAFRDEAEHETRRQGVRARNRRNKEIKGARRNGEAAQLQYVGRVTLRYERLNEHGGLCRRRRAVRCWRPAAREEYLSHFRRQAS